jgi:hypothetical protein
MSISMTLKFGATAHICALISEPSSQDAIGVRAGARR